MPLRDFRPLPVLVLSVGFSLLPTALMGQEDIPDGSELTISPADRILTLATFWSEAKYNFAFWDRLPDLNWDATFAEYSVRALNVESDIEFFRLAIEFGDLLRLSSGCRNTKQPAVRIGREDDRAVRRVCRNVIRCN